MSKRVLGVMVSASRWSLLASLWTLLVVLSRGTNAWAVDYDPQSSDWNGLRELVRLASVQDVQLRTNNVLDWSQLRRGDGLLVLYPKTAVELSDLAGFLDDGGRLGLFDDFGDGEALFQWFQVARTEQAHGTPRNASMPDVLMATRRAEHALAEGVDELVTNRPAVLLHPRLSPLFALGEDNRQGIVLAGQVNRGRLVLGGDPSVLINTMLRFPGNRQFARNLLRFLGGTNGGQVVLVHGAFTQRGAYRGRGQARTSTGMVVQAINELLSKLSTMASDAPLVRVLAATLAALVILALGVRVWGEKPSDRFGPSSPAGAAASLHEKMALFAEPRANMLYPTLVAKRVLERALLRAARLEPPTDLRAVLDRLKDRLNEGTQKELRVILVELDDLATGLQEQGSAKVGVRRFLSLWGRIGAILRDLGGLSR